MLKSLTDGITYYSFKNLSSEKGVHHLFSTRLGGVSEGVYESMNLNFKTGDNPEKVRQNFQRIAELGFPVEDMVFAHQTHQCQVRKVTATDRGKGILVKRDYTDIDGLITNDPTVTLVTFYADCVPLYFYDPVQRAIGLSHAGWRGTVGQIGAVTVQAMVDNYRSNPQDILVGIGPSICKDCFEVGNEVAEEFTFGDPLFPSKATPSNSLSHSTSEFVQALEFASNFITPCPDKPNKSYIDLQGINKQSLIKLGIPAASIELPNICTKENPDTFFSHRVMGTARGSLAAFMRLCEF